MVSDKVYRYDKDYINPKEVVASGFTDPADIFFNKKHGILAVPNFNANRVDFIPLDVGIFTRIWGINPVQDGGSSFGISWADYNQDGCVDAFLTNNIASDGQANFLYTNSCEKDFTKIQTGEMTSVINCSYSSTWGDCDNDGDLDLFVANSGERANNLYINNADSTFTIASGIEMVTAMETSVSASWIDYNSDGNLDLFVSNHGANSLFRNSGTEFIKISENAITTGVENSNGASWGDYNSDGNPDLFIAISENSNNQLFRNEGSGVFTKIDGQDIVNDGGDSFGGSWGDYDNDGDLDFFVSNASLTSPGNNFLYENLGDGTFSRIYDGAIVNDGGFSLGSSWGDYDNDGYLDLFVANTSWGLSPGKDFLYHNNGDGSFTRIIECEIVDEVEDSRGVAWADYDNDGDLDLLVARVNGENSAPNGFYRNNGNDNNWICVKCIGKISNGAAIGTQIRIKAEIGGVLIWQLREISGQTGFCGQNDLIAHFGIGDASKIDSIVIIWPSGLQQVYTDVNPNHVLVVTDYQCGDANSDTQANVGDAVFIINHVFKSGPGPEPIEAGDANCDSQCNVGDAVYLINHVFKGGPAPCEEC